MKAGELIGPYRVLEMLGEGGMGEVYRAHDTRLDRDVAIKIVPELLAADPDRMARFEREARTLASLNHPHIAQVYGVEGSSGGPGSTTALVMELVEGDDLTARIGRGPLPLVDALPIAQQIADALEAAHERGIIHRDLKPANIKVTADGRVKVLDFGLAKSIDASAGATDPANSPTMAMTGTMAGLILGTAGYMAPEQARGQTVDRRADIWAFGVVLFEMLSGQQAFSGETISDVLASVLKNDLDWSRLPKNLPPTVLTLLRRCLDPDRRTRLRDIGEARIAITDILAGRSSGDAPSVGPARGSRLPAMLASATAVLLLIGLIGGAWALSRPTRGEVSRRYVVTPPQGVTTDEATRPSVALAPDGWTLVFVGLDNGLPHLYLRSAGEFDPRLLPGTAGATHPVFSPDGRTLAFFADNRLMVMPLDGSPRALAAVNDPRGLTWVDDTTVVYAPESVGGLQELSVNGGSPRTVTTVDDKAEERTHRWPHALRGGRWLLFTIGSIASPDDYEQARIDAVDRETGERREVLRNASLARVTPTGHLVFAREGALFAVPFDADAFEPRGSPVTVISGVAGDRTTGAVHVDWSANGTLAYLPGDVRGGMRQLIWADAKGSRESINLRPALFNDVRLSPDGSRLALADNASGIADIWVYTFSRGTYTRLTFTGTNATPVWSPDGREVYFSAIDGVGRNTTVFRTIADGGSQPTPILTTDVRIYLKHVSADRSWALADYLAFGGARANIGRLTLREGEKIQPLVETRSDEFGAALSPDGRFFAYRSDEGTRPEVYVRELEGSGGRWQISNAGGEEPMWAADGKSLFYRVDGRLMRVSVETRDGFTAGVPTLMFDGVFNLRSDTGVSYHPHPDGTRFLMIRPAETASSGSIRLITNWFETLKTVR